MNLLHLTHALAGWQKMRACLATLLLLATLAALPAVRAHAQEEPSGTSYITPFPEGDTYRIQVYGDAFAEGLLGRTQRGLRR